MFGDLWNIFGRTYMSMVYFFSGLLNPDYFEVCRTRSLTFLLVVKLSNEENPSSGYIGDCTPQLLCGDHNKP